MKMGNEHKYKLKQEIEATNEIKMMIRFLFYPKVRPKGAEIIDYKWIYPTISHDFKHKENGTDIEIKYDRLVKFSIIATNINFNDELKRFIEILGLRGEVIGLEVEGEKIY